MLKIKLKDGSIREYDSAVSVESIARDIGESLARNSIAAKVNNTLVDISYRVQDNADLEIITQNSTEALEIIRHSTAHLMGMAVQNLFPGTQVTIGPVIENGFYYDFVSDHRFSEADFPLLEQEMSRLSKLGLSVQRSVWQKSDAIAKFKAIGELFKIELIDDIADGEDISIYTQGDWFDLCRGPHVPNTKFLQHFKLLSVSGSYWRGDSKNQMLQRIYGTAWTTKKELKQYLFFLAESEKRDHRKLGKKLQLFHLQDEAPGMVFWHPKGYQLYSTIEHYIRQQQLDSGYYELKTPQIIDRKLWERSGHWDKFRENMFVVEVEERTFAIKPMNCPCHIQVYNQQLHSYKDLPLRYAEFGSCHRNELSGTLQGLMRVRSFVQDDGHIFCREEQIQSEVIDFIDLVYKIYKDFGFEDVIVNLSTRPEQRVGSDAVWDQSEQALATALDSKQLQWQYLKGEGAFYGPKVEFSLRDCLGRVWQCGTIQVDFSMPERLGAQYITAEGKKQVPVMLHRAVLGSFERFIGMLIENSDGHFPLWLAPVQLAIVNITSKQEQYCVQLYRFLIKNGIRAEKDLRNETVGYKIRTYSVARVPYIVVVGEKEVQSEQVALRDQRGNDLGLISQQQLLSRLSEEIGNKRKFN